MKLNKRTRADILVALSDLLGEDDERLELFWHLPYPTLRKTVLRGMEIKPEVKDLTPEDLENMIE